MRKEFWYKNKEYIIIDLPFNENSIEFILFDKATINPVELDKSSKVLYRIEQEEAVMDVFNDLEKYIEEYNRAMLNRIVILKNEIDLNNEKDIEMIKNKLLRKL